MGRTYRMAWKGPTLLRTLWVALSIALLNVGCNAIVGNELHSLGVGKAAPDDAAADDSTVSNEDGKAPDGGRSLSPDVSTSPRDATVGIDAVADSTADESVDPSSGVEASTASRDASVAGSDSGTVGLCTAGGDCAPNECQRGTWVCVDGGRVCQETTPIASGTPCGSSADAGAHVCNAGQCVACNAGGDCSDPGLPCVRKSFDCSSGTAQCTTTDNIADGVPCGGGLNCNAGICAACQVGAPCTPTANACHVGKVTACTASVATCTDQGIAAATGKPCPIAGGASGVCDGASNCLACSAGSQCNPGADICQVGVQACSTGPQCKNAVAVREGQTCGTAQICHNGACAACDGTSCAGGCCDSRGCVTTAQTVTECGTGTAGGSCTTCSGPSSGIGSSVCTSNACTVVCIGTTPDLCNGTCVSFNSDDKNCGSCGHTCMPGFHCDGSGVCNCAPKTNACAGSACGQASDGCGRMVACGTCTAPLTCNGSGQCVNTTCPTSCPMGDNCGSISNIGCSTLICGTCTAPQTSCSAAAGSPGTCVCTPKTNANACAGSVCGQASDGCGNRVTCGTCATGLGCVSGSCTCDTTSCPNGCCASGTCAPKALWYPDNDQDGYGDMNALPVASCVKPAPGGLVVGYVSNNGDCCDVDSIANPSYLASNAANPWRIQPDQCGSFLWNCEANGIPVMEFAAPACPGAYPTCTNNSGGLPVDCALNGCATVCARNCTDYAGPGTTTCGMAVNQNDYTCTQAGSLCTANSTGHIVGVQGCY